MELPMKRIVLLLILLPAAVFTGCSDDDKPDWLDGPVAGGDPVAAGSAYTVRDYLLPAGSSIVQLSNLQHGERVVLIPLHPDPEVTSDATVFTCFRLRATYSGDAVPALLPRHAPAHSMPQLPYRLKGNSDDFNPTAAPRPAGFIPGRNYLPGDTASFYLPVDFDDRNKGYTYAPAKLLYSGTHCHIFFTAALAAHSNAGMIATNAGRDFDTVIYPRITARFGFENGGGPGGDGGLDNDQRVTILYENVTVNPPGGYFSSRDQTDGENSNRREMFYICHRPEWLDSGYARHATIAHEFQHLIEHNRVYLATGQRQLSFFNEGLSQVAEGYAGYGPDMRMSYVQEDPQLSYAAWRMDGKPVTYSYGAAFAVTSYMVRRFGADFINALLDAPISSVANVSNALFLRGYTDGYAGIVLDTLTAHYLDRDQYRYPPAGLYPGDTGIPTRGAYPGWYGYPAPKTNNWILSGIRTKFHRSYPAEIRGDLYRYGADLYEFVSGSNGVLRFLFNDTAPGTRLRVIRFRPATDSTLFIDGRSDDWNGKPLTAVADPAGDHDRLNDNSPAGAFAGDGVDILSVQGFLTDSNLYLQIKTAAPAELNNDNNYFMLRLRPAADPAIRYDLYLYKTHAWFRKSDNSGELPVTQPPPGVLQYARAETVELQLPLNLFPDWDGATVKIAAYGYTTGETQTIFDFPAEELVLTR